MKRYDKITGVLAVAALSLFSACSEDTMDRINKDHDHTTSAVSYTHLTLPTKLEV